MSISACSTTTLSVAMVNNASEKTEKASINVDLEAGQPCHNHEPHTVKRDLKPRHVAMMALGGTIGTGLFFGTQRSLADAGPLGSLLAFLFMATIVYSISQSVGEMTTHIPITGSFAVFVSRFLSPALGAAVGWMYWFSWAVTFAIELAVIGQIITFWVETVPEYVWITLFLVLLTCTNFLPVKIFGEIEFWSACFKVTVISAWIVYSFIMVVGGGSNGVIGFKYWKDPGLFGPGILVDNLHAGQFLGFLSTLVNAAFTFQGVELVGVSAGEASNPRRAIPRVINRTFFRILVLFILCIMCIGLLVPFDHPLLMVKGGASPLFSPFVLAIMNSGTQVFPHIFNAIILIIIISAGNSNVYIGSRLLFAICSEKLGPKFLTYTTRHGVPIFSVLATSSIGLLSFMVLTSGSAVFNWLLNIGAVAGIICWISIAFSYLRFTSACKVKGIDRKKEFVFVAWGGRPYAIYAAVCLIIILIIQGFPAYFEWSAYSFLTTHLSIIIFIFLWILFYFVLKAPFLIPLEEMDLTSGSRVAGSEEVQEKPEELSFWGKVLDIIF